ncbi:MAG TPA: TolC family protein [bacterium]|nr:TolC family protein [bacterium]
MLKLRIFSVLLLILFACSLNAQEQQALGFEEALKHALEKNPAVTGAASDVRSAEAVVEKTYAMFDLMMKAGVNYAESKPVVTSILSPEEAKVLAYNAGLSNKLFTGGFLSVDFTTSKTTLFYPVIDSGVFPISIDPALFTTAHNPSYTPKLSLSYMQPILKDFWGRPDQKAIKAGALMVNMSKEGMRSAVINTVASLKEAYYFVYMAGLMVKIQKDFYDDAEKFYNETVSLKKIGLREERDVLQTKASVLDSKAEIAPAENNYRFAAENFLNAAGYRPDEWEKFKIETSGEPESAVIPEKMTTALENTLVEMQPAVMMAKTGYEMAVTGREIAENSSLPSLNLVGSYGIEGAEGALSESFQMLREGNNREFMVGAMFSYSFPNRGSSGEVKEKREGAKKALEQYEAAKSMTRIQVRSSYRAVVSAKDNYEMKKEAARLQQKRLKIESSNFSQGRISTRELLMAQMDYHTSRIKETAAFYDYIKAVSAWNKINGKYDSYYNELAKQ